MNRIELYKLLRRNMKLSEKRHPMFEQNQYAKVFAYLGLAFMSIYFIGIGTFIGWSARGGDESAIFIMMAFLMILDFGMRFGGQQTPSLLIKPYLLMPIKKSHIVDCFIVMSMISSYNIIWLTVILPYAFIVWCGGLGGWETIALILLCQAIVILNALWYMLVRTLVNQKIWWWVLPLAVYGAAIGIPMLVYGVEKGFTKLVEFIFDYGFSWACAAVVAVLICILFVVNSWLSRRLADSEVAAEEEKTFSPTTRFSFLEQFGMIGEYLSLEVKSAMRNKAIRQRYIQGLLVITMLSLLLAFTDTYTGAFAVNIWCLYCFVFFGAVNLVKIMAPEGNYIDFLFTRRESILDLLRAKYYFFCIVLVLPLLLLIPPIVSGRFSILMILAYLFITTGVAYGLLFQLAVYNKQSLPLNQKITSKGNFENKLQFIIELVVFFVPVFLALAFTALFGDTIGYIIMIVIGVVMTAAHPYWLRNIYTRMMRRRYENIEGFHATR